MAQNTEQQIFLCRITPLRVANLSSGPDGHSTSWGDYRAFGRQYAKGFGDESLGQAPDQLFFDEIAFLMKHSCLGLKSFDNGWKDFQEGGDIGTFVTSRNGFNLKLTAEGRALLAQMESESPFPPKRQAIGF